MAAPETKGWIGERSDADAGLQYLNARYYDPELSLFLYRGLPAAETQPENLRRVKGAERSLRAALAGNERLCGHYCSDKYRIKINVLVGGGGGGIRTHGRVPPTSVFKTEAIDHSATPPTLDP